MRYLAARYGCEHIQELQDGLYADLWRVRIGEVESLPGGFVRAADD